MPKTMNLYTNKGFLNLNNLKFSQVYYYIKNSITLENPKVTTSPSYTVQLSTGITYQVSSEDLVKGLLLSKNTIDNEMDECPISSYTFDDYLYTPFNSDIDFIEDPSFIKLSKSSQPYLEYVDCDFIALAEVHSKTIKDILSDKTFLEAHPIIGSIPNSILVDGHLLDFLVTSILRSKIETTYQIIDNDEYISKKISYRFKKENELHLSMHKGLVRFLNKLNIKYNTVDYDHYFYINIYSNPLAEYLHSFIISDFEDVFSFSFENQKLFLEKLFKYSKNNFYTVPSTYFSLKNLCYNTRQVLSLSYRSNTSKEINPLCVSLIEEKSSEYELSPEVLLLDSGYLTRIVSIEEDSEPTDIIKNYLLIG